MRHKTEKTVVQALQDDFIPFASDALINFLPSVGDGLLPVNRKVIYAMYQNGVTSNKSYIKMLRAAAMAMTYYVYGDMPLNKAMKNMGNNSLNYMYLDPKGSFGDKQKREGVGASARYIECRLSEYSEDMLRGINKDNVPSKRNFDNTEDEPIVLPSMMPNVLLNTTQSIATGESSKIPAHNLVEVCDSFISYLETQDINKSIDILQGCDLSLGGKIVYDREQWSRIYNTGRGSFTLIGSYTYDEQENKITITEVPYETYIETIETRLRSHYDRGNFKEVLDIHDGSDKDGIALDIYLKQGTDIDQFIAKLRRFTPFESKMSCNFTLLDLDGRTPKLMSLEDIITKWIEHRRQCIVSELEHDIGKLEVEQNRLKGLETALLDLDKAIHIVRSSSSDNKVIDNLTKEFDFNPEQANYVASIRLRNMNKDWIRKRIEKLESITKSINEMKSNLDDDDFYKNEIIRQLEYGKKKYGMARKTEVVNQEDLVDFKEENTIEDYNCQIVFTKNGHLKKTNVYSDNQFTSPDDYVLQQVPATNKSKLLLFTSHANCYYINIWELNTVRPSQLGVYLSTHLGLEEGERVLYVTPTTDYSGYMLYAFENGKMAKVELSSYEVKTNRTRTLNAFNTNSKIVGLDFVDDEDDVDYITRTSIDKAIIFNSSQISSRKATTSQGLTVVNQRQGSVSTSLERLDEDIDDEIKDYYSINVPAVGNFNRGDI